MSKDKPTRTMILKVQYRKSAEQLLAKRNATFKYTNDETIQPIEVIFSNKKTRLFILLSTKLQTETESGYQMEESLNILV